jgi:hypothetical protein
MSYADWLENNPPALDMLPEQQRKFRRQIIAGCIGIGDCWVWSGAKTTNGDGNIWVDYSTRLVSRLALCLSTGASLSMNADACHIPECPSRACCNSAHLFWGTHGNNCSMREARDARWDRYVNAMEPGSKDVFVGFEKRYKPGWGWLGCRSVQVSQKQRSRIIPEPMPNQSMMFV